MSNSTFIGLLIVFLVLGCGQSVEEAEERSADVTTSNPKEEIQSKGSEVTPTTQQIDKDEITSQEEVEAPPSQPKPDKEEVQSASNAVSPPKPVKKKRSYPKIDFEEPTFDFEELESGEKTDHKFVFTNAGKAPLEIKNVHVSCGCTVPSYPFIPIEPGEDGYIGVSYNSVGKSGFQRATIRVITNDPKQKEVILTIEGTVTEKEKEEEGDDAQLER